MSECEGGGREGGGRGADTELKIKGTDNPTNQFLPIMSQKCCSGDGEGRKDKGGGGGKIVCDQVACER